MRIIAGAFRGKKLFSPDSDKVRPTSDRAREALFNILNSTLPDAWENYHLLDVFAGTGAFGLEALSRGAASVGLVDQDTRSLQKNVKLFPSVEKRIRIFRQDVLKLSPAPQAYDLVFMDAPYQKGLSEPALRQLASQGWIRPHALCLVEVEKNEQLDLPSCFKLQNERIYGLARVLFLRYEPDGVEENK